MIDHSFLFCQFVDAGTTPIWDVRSIFGDFWHGYRLTVPALTVKTIIDLVPARTWTARSNFLSGYSSYNIWTLQSIADPGTARIWTIRSREIDSQYFSTKLQEGLRLHKSTKQLAMKM